MDSANSDIRLPDRPCQEGEAVKSVDLKVTGLSDHQVDSLSSKVVPPDRACQEVETPQPVDLSVKSTSDYQMDPPSSEVLPSERPCQEDEHAQPVGLVFIGSSDCHVNFPLSDVPLPVRSCQEVEIPQPVELLLTGSSDCQVDSPSSEMPPPDRPCQEGEAPQPADVPVAGSSDCQTGNLSSNIPPSGRPRRNVKAPQWRLLLAGSVNRRINSSVSNMRRSSSRLHQKGKAALAEALPLVTSSDHQYTVQRCEEAPTSETVTPLTFTIVPSSSQRGHAKLCDSAGFTYCIHHTRNGKTKWRCSMRRKSMTCHAAVSQCGDQFVPSPAQHCHDPKEGIELALKVSAEVKRRCTEDLVRAASEITSEVLKEMVPCSTTDGDAVLLPATASLARQGCRQRLRAKQDFKENTASKSKRRYLLTDQSSRKQCQKGKASLRVKLPITGASAAVVDARKRPRSSRLCQKCKCAIVQDDARRPDSSSDVPEARQENSLAEKAPNVNPAVTALTYTIIPSSSLRGRAKLCDSAGFTYVVRYTRKGKTMWRCSVKRNSLVCSATVIQCGEHFVPGSAQHCHEPKKGVELALRVSAEVKRRCTENVHRAASDIASEVLTEMVPLNIPNLCGIPLPKQTYLARQGSRKRMRAKREYLGDLGFIPKQKLPSVAGSRRQRQKDKPTLSVDVPITSFSDHQYTALRTWEAVSSESNSAGVQDGTSQLNISYDVPGAVEEVLVTETGAIDPPSFAVVPSSSERGHAKLCDSAGYTYCVHYTRNEKTKWRCSVRSKSTKCRATVTQCGEQFVPSIAQHCHDPKEGIELALRVSAEVKRRCTEDVERAAADIASEVLTEMVPWNTPDLCSLPLPKPINLARQGSRKRLRWELKQKNLRPVGTSSRRQKSKPMLPLSVAIEGSSNILIDSPVPDILLSSKQVHEVKATLSLAPSDIQIESSLSDMACYSRSNPRVQVEAALPVDMPFADSSEHLSAAECSQETLADVPIATSAPSASFPCNFPEALELQVEEVSLEETSTDVGASSAAASALTFTVVPSSSQRGHPKLCDSAGFTYVIHHKGNEKTSWRCSMRRKSIYCPAKVSQCGEHFVPGPAQHCHDPKEGVELALRVSAEVKRRCAEDVDRAASEIASEVLTEMIAKNTPDSCAIPLPKPTNLAKQGGRIRQCAKREHIGNANSNPKKFMQV